MDGERGAEYFSDRTAAVASSATGKTIRTAINYSVTRPVSKGSTCYPASALTGLEHQGMESEPAGGLRLPPVWLETFECQGCDTMLKK
jgi:hypothetical protein